MVGVDPQYAGGKLHVRLDEPNGPVIGTLVLASTGGFEIFQPQSVALWATPGPCAKGDATGTHLLWFTIEGKAVCNFKAFRVLDASGAISIPTRAAPTDPAGASADSRYQALCANAAKSDAKIAFVGDSVTQSWEEAGRAIWDKQIAPFKAINLGIGGDRVENMIWRIENGNLPDTLNPKAVVIMAGTNNITFVAGITPEAIAAGNRELIARIRKRKPGCKVLLLGIFPRRDALDTFVQKANPELAKLADNKTVFFLDFGAKFRLPDGTPDPKCFADAVDISADGYQIWADAMLPTLKKLLAE
jgi:lysophospholipase L1-like esterase